MFCNQQNVYVCTVAECVLVDRRWVFSANWPVVAVSAMVRQ